jgi:hypothetical protein
MSTFGGKADIAVRSAIGEVSYADFHLTDGKQVLNNHKGIDLPGRRWRSHATSNTAQWQSKPFARPIVSCLIVSHQAVSRCAMILPESTAPIWSMP